MGEYTEEQIKGAIGQVIAEEMFREFGFLVLKFGKEHTANPLTQLKEFVKNCGGNFKPDKESEAKEHIDCLPDFIIVDPKTGMYELIEVKFRHNGLLYWDIEKENRHSLTMELHPAKTLVINLTVHDKLFEQFKDAQKDKEGLQKTRFHLYEVQQIKGKTGWEEILLSSFTQWLKDVFDKENLQIIKKYEQLVDKWVNKK